MPRNAQGLYVLPAGNPVTPGTIIESVWANTTMSDLADAMTGSLPRDGSAPMTGPLTLNGATPTNARHAVDKQYVDGFIAFASGFPIGSVTAYAGATVPPGYLECNGQAISRTTYADLFTAIGTTYGAGDSSTTFNVPDMRDEFIRGKSDSRAVGSKQVASFASHTHVVSDPTHTHAQQPHSHSVTTNAHTHGVSDPGHSHSTPVGATQAGVEANSGTGSRPFNPTNTGANVTGIGIQSAAPTGTAAAIVATNTAAATGISLGAAGGGETVPQNIAQIYIIKAVNDSAGPVPVTGIDTSDAQMLSVDNTNPVVPELVIHSNVAFGTVKLDGGGKIPLNQMPTTSQQLLGYFDASSGQNPTEKYPTQAFFAGDTYIVSVEGTITVYSPVTLTPSATLVTVGGLLQYITGSVTNPTGWYFVAAVATTQASQVGFTPSGSIGATNVQDALVELDGDVITNSNDIFDLQGDYNSLVAADAGLQSQITDNTDAIAGLSSPTASTVTFVPSGTIVATNVQNALQELDGDKVSVALPVMSGTLNMGAGAKTNYGGTTGVLQVGGEDALEINQTAKTIKGINGYLMVGNGPAVRVIAGGTTSIPASTVTKVLLDTEEFDTNNNFANSRFTPTVAGYYSVTGQVGWGSTTVGNALCAIYKNGVAVANSAYVALIAAGLTQNAATLVYCNGTTDYIELWAAQTSAGALNVVPTTTNFTACLVRAA